MCVCVYPVRMCDCIERFVHADAPASRSLALPLVLDLTDVYFIHHAMRKQDMFPKKAPRTALDADTSP